MLEGLENVKAGMGRMASVEILSVYKTLEDNTIVAIG